MLQKDAAQTDVMQENTIRKDRFQGVLQLPPAVFRKIFAQQRNKISK